MLDALETAMSWLRRFKLYVTLGSALAAALAIAIVKVTEQLLIGLTQAGNTFTERLMQNEIAALAVFIGIGYAIYSKCSDSPVKFDVPVAIGSFALGIVGVAVFFWLLPALAHTLAVEVLSPLLKFLSAFLKGEIAVSLTLFAKILFSVYLLSFAVDALIEHYIRKRDIGPAVERMLSKYWKELLDVLHDLYEVLAFLPKLLWARRSQPPSE
jgi:hypothetical protein